MAILHLGPPSPLILLKDPCPYILSFQKEPCPLFYFQRKPFHMKHNSKYALDLFSLVQIFLEIANRSLPSRGVITTRPLTDPRTSTKPIIS
jgi:hypothetical protein